MKLYINGKDKNYYTKEEIDKSLESYMSNDITYEKIRDTQTETTYVVMTVPAKDNIKWEVSVPLEWNKTNNLVETPRKQCLDNDFTVCINAGLIRSNGAPIGTTIRNGEVLTDEIGTLSNWFLAINKETGMFESGKLTSYTIDELSDKYDNLITSFIPIIVDGESVGENILADCPNGAVKHPRQIICQKEDGTVIIITSDGRRQSEQGWTLVQAQEICKQYNVSFAFNLDGGGSAQTIYRGTLISNPIDNYHTDERKIYSCLGFKIKSVQNEKDKDIKTLSKMISDIKSELDYIKHYHVFDRGYIQFKAYDIDADLQGIEVYDNNIRTNKLQLSKDSLCYFNTEGENPLTIFKVNSDGLITTPYGNGYVQNRVANNGGYETPDDINITGFYWFTADKLGIEDGANAYALQHIQAGETSALQIITPYSNNNEFKPKRRVRDSAGVWLDWIDNI